MTMYGNIMIESDVEQTGTEKEAKDSLWNSKRTNDEPVYFDWANYKPITFKFAKKAADENSGLNAMS